MTQRIAIALVLLLAASSALADVSVTDKQSALRAIARSDAATRLTPQQKQAVRDANAAKRAEKRKKHSGKLHKVTNGLHARPNANVEIQLADASGLTYFINTDVTFTTSSSASGAASEASYSLPVMASTSAGGVVTTTLSDMFDGYGAMCIGVNGVTGPCKAGDPNYFNYYQNGPAAFDTSVPATPECTNRQIVYPVKTLNGITMQRKVFVPTNDQFIRWMNIFTNTTGAPVTFNAITSNNLGSDNLTTIVTSSNGDAVAQPTDLWITSFQDFMNGVSPDPRIGHVLQGAGAPTPVSTVHFVNGDDNPYWDYPITLNPGQTKIVIFYATGQPTKAAAAAQAAAIAAFGPNERQCMSNTELSQVVNFLTGTDLAITNTPSSTTVNAGAPYSYTLQVTNNGPSTANNVTVSDLLPSGAGYVGVTGTGWTCNQTAGTVTCTTASLPIGAANPITINVTAPASGGSISSTATVSSSTTELNNANNSSTANVTVVPQADLSITNTPSATQVNASAPFSYTIAVNNAGPSTASNVSVTDTLPAGVTYTGATGTGWTCNQTSGTVTCTTPSLATSPANPITINVTAPPNGSATSDTATVTSATADPNTTNNTSGAASVTVVSQADLSITNTPSATQVNASAPFSYTITVNNGGPSTASSVTVTDTLPTGVTYTGATGTGWTCNQVSGAVTCTMPSLATGAANPITINVTAPPNGGATSDVATVTSATADPNAANNSSTANVTVVSQADLSIAKTSSTNQIATNAPFHYTISVTNAGPSSAANVSVTDTLPAGVTYVSANGSGWTCNQTAGTVTCTMPSLAAGTANPITINVMAGPTARSTANMASVSSTTADPTPGNNTSAAAAVAVTVPIPTLDPRALALLALALGVVAVAMMRKA